MSKASFCADTTGAEKERVDIFGDASGDKSNEAARNVRSPVIYKARSIQKNDDRRIGFAAVAALTVVLTVAFTSLMYLIYSEFNNEPYEKAGGYMGEILFGELSIPEDSNAALLPTDTAQTPSQAIVSDDTDANTDSGISGSSEPVSGTSSPVPDATEHESAIISDESSPVSLGDGFIDSVGIGVDAVGAVSAWGDEVRNEINGGKVLILCTHSLEMTADGAYITEVAGALGEALTAAGIEVELCDESFDSEGRLGAYARARATIEERLAYGDIALILDMHLGYEPGIYVGTRGCTFDDRIWGRNLALAVMVNDALDTFRGNVILDGGGYNQDLPVLMLHAEFDSSENANRVSKYARILADAILRVIRQAR